MRPDPIQISIERFVMGRHRFCERECLLTYPRHNLLNSWGDDLQIDRIWLGGECISQETECTNIRGRERVANNHDLVRSLESF
jgi:hypothetical protein